MKASIFREFGGPEKLVYEDVPVPSIGRDEVLVRVRACGLNHLDIWVRQGDTCVQADLTSHIRL